MGSHKPWKKVEAEARAARALEKLSGVFLHRLQGERLQLVTLSAALASSESSPKSIFQDLQFRAHRLKGAAAIFEFQNLAGAAQALEMAASDAVDAGAEHGNAAVWSALVALVGLLGNIASEEAAQPLTGANEQRWHAAQ